MRNELFHTHTYLFIHVAGDAQGRRRHDDLQLPDQVPAACVTTARGPTAQAKFLGRWRRSRSKARYIFEEGTPRWVHTISITAEVQRRDELSSSSRGAPCRRITTCPWAWESQRRALPRKEAGTPAKQCARSFETVCQWKPFPWQPPWHGAATTMPAAPPRHRAAATMPAAHQPPHPHPNCSAA